MPFTASLGDDRKKNKKALCRDFPDWDGMSWTERRAICIGCEHRFAYQPSCNLDFLAIGDSEMFVEELTKVLGWIAKEDPSWQEFDGAVHEVEAAYLRMDTQVPTPKVVIQNFIKYCTEVPKDREFWKFWNHIGVEQYDGASLKREYWGRLEDTVREMADRVFDVFTGSSSFSVPGIYYLYSATALLSDSKLQCQHAMRDAMQQLNEACKHAIELRATLEVS